MTAAPENYENLSTDATGMKLIITQQSAVTNWPAFFCVVPEGDSFEIGLGLRPDLCGKGVGKEFLAQILDFICRRYRCKRLIMKVALFNQRAIKAYHSCGFKNSAIEKQKTNGKLYEFLTLVKKI